MRDGDDGRADVSIRPDGRPGGPPPRALAMRRRFASVDFARTRKFRRDLARGDRDRCRLNEGGGRSSLANQLFKVSRAKLKKEAR